MQGKFNIIKISEIIENDSLLIRRDWGNNGDILTHQVSFVVLFVCDVTHGNENSMSFIL